MALKGTIKRAPVLIRLACLGIGAEGGAQHAVEHTKPNPGHCDTHHLVKPSGSITKVLAKGRAVVLQSCNTPNISHRRRSHPVLYRILFKRTFTGGENAPWQMPCTSPPASLFTGQPPTCKHLLELFQVRGAICYCLRQAHYILVACWLLAKVLLVFGHKCVLFLYTLFWDVEVEPEIAAVDAGYGAA